MSALATDKFKKVAPNTGWQLDASGISDASVDTFGLVSATNIPTGTGVKITIDRVDSSGASTPSKMERIDGVISGSNVINCVRGVEGTAQAHAGGAVVEIVISADLWNDTMDGMLVGHNQDGSHKVIPLNAPEGFLINGKIVPSVASNNLTVALKTKAGEDPSADDPVYVMIGGTLRTITSALSVTKNAGANWFNAGSSELAAQEIDFFVYLGYNATDGVVIGFSRIPYGKEYDDFSITSTNEKYCAISTITNAAAGDDYEVIGRFAATLSAGAGYTWTVPTFTNKNLIQRPIYETRWLTYVDTKKKYKIRNRTLIIEGWSFVTGAGAISLSETLSYGFTYSDREIITCNTLGYKTSDPTGIADLSAGVESDGVWIIGPVCSENSASIRMRKEIGEVFASGRRYMYLYRVIGKW